MWKLRSGQGRVAMNKSVSKRKFDYALEERIQKLKQIKLKKSCESKLDWAVTAYCDWRNDRLERYDYDSAIYFADLLDLEKLQKDNLNHALCRFVSEVTRKRGTGPFPGATLYQMVVAIQKYLTVNKLKWKLIEGEEFQDCHTVLDHVMQE